MTETAALKREVCFDIGERLDKLLLNVAIVLPPPKITQQQAVGVSCKDALLRALSAQCIRFTPKSGHSPVD